MTETHFTPDRTDPDREMLTASCRNIIKHMQEEAKRLETSADYAPAHLQAEFLQAAAQIRQQAFVIDHLKRRILKKYSMSTDITASLMAQGALYYLEQNEKEVQ